MQFFSQVNFFYALPQCPAENDPLQATTLNIHGLFCLIIIIAV